MESLEQRTEQWYEKRRGKLTSSEIHKIILGSRTKTIEESDTAMSYIFKKIDELRTGTTDRQIDNFSMQWGTYYEDVAKQYLQNETGLIFTEIDFKEYEKYPLFCGGSPDFLTENAIGEIKCPEQLGGHSKYSYLIKDAESLKAEKKEYYWQCIANALFCDKKNVIFISFDNRQKGKNKLHLIEFEVPENDFKILKTSIKNAVEVYVKILKALEK